jgi:hypothetical protein
MPDKHADTYMKMRSGRAAAVYSHRHERESTATNTLRSTVHVRPGRTELATELSCRTAAQRSHAMRSSVAESWRKGLGPGVPSPICN